MCVCLQFDRCNKNYFIEFEAGINCYYLNAELLQDALIINKRTDNLNINVSFEFEC